MKKTNKNKGSKIKSLSDQYDNESGYSDVEEPRADVSPRKELFLLEPRTLITLAFVSAITLLITVFGGDSMQFLSSVVSPVPQHAPFDGTTYPVVQVPNYVKLTEAERKLPYSSLPKSKLISIPTYAPSRLSASIDTLKWNNPTDDAIRNEKITYSVPYLGSYNLDGLEGTGSHPAVDIKIPEGTPLVAIANGTVVKVDSNGYGGFGKHVVIQHNNVPTLDDPNKKTTLYSSYSHMSSTSVQLYQVLTRGQIIGYSGSTGTATTPHIHFQIDTDSAAWHPYWPFSTADMKAAGYTFFQSINNGLGKANAKQNTINPLAYVQKYLTTASPSQAIVSTPPTLVATTEPVVDPYEKVSFTVQVAQATSLKEGATADVIVSGFNENGTLMTSPAFSDTLSLNLQTGIGTLSTTQLTSAQFTTGITHISITNLKQGSDRISLHFKSKEFLSDQFTVSTATAVVTPPVEVRPVADQPVSSFSLITDQSDVYLPNSVGIHIKAFDSSSAVAQRAHLEQTVTLNPSGVAGTLSKTTLTDDDFTNGEATVQFVPSALGVVTIQLSYKGDNYSTQPMTIHPESEAPVVTPQPVTAATTTEPIVTPEVTTTPSTADLSAVFTDVAITDELTPILKSLKDSGIVTGYSDGTFRPSNPVSRAEAIAFILRTIDKKPSAELQKLFPDVNLDAWYSTYVKAAYELNFVKGYPDGTFKPEATVNLAELLKMLFIAVGADVDPVITVSLPSGVTGSDWFAPFVQAAMKKNILTIENNTLDAGTAMTRASVARLIYKLKNN